MSKDDKKPVANHSETSNSEAGNSEQSNAQPTKAMPSIEVTASHESATDTDVQESLIEFPTRFPIKAIGKHDEAFIQAVHAIVDRTIPAKDLLDIQEQLSSHERYLSFTIIATFYDQAGIDAVYQALTDEPLVLMAL